MQAAAISGSHPASQFFSLSCHLGHLTQVAHFRVGQSTHLCHTQEQHCGFGREGGREAEAKLNLQLGNSSELNVKELGKDWWLCPWHIAGKRGDFLIQIQHMLIFTAVHFFQSAYCFPRFPHTKVDAHVNFWSEFLVLHATTSCSFLRLHLFHRHRTGGLSESD